NRQPTEKATDIDIHGFSFPSGYTPVTVCDNHTMERKCDEIKMSAAGLLRSDPEAVFIFCLLL
ncbi:MAG TPA: hypothetical protein PLY90_09300, partial [Candidatus Hydrogenedentes bacterium]|nr:hypothetical protein [Candidatus Hydrogenedentota bacterium]